MKAGKAVMQPTMRPIVCSATLHDHQPPLNLSDDYYARTNAKSATLVNKAVRLGSLAL